MLAATAAGGVVTAATMTTANAAPVKSDITFGNPNDPPQGAINAKNPRSISDPGPQNRAIRDQFPGAFSPPATDVGSMPLSWASFNNAPRRIQNGGWARQVTQDSFAVADTISGVNMRLTSGGIRRLYRVRGASRGFVSTWGLRRSYSERCETLRIAHRAADHIRADN